MITQQNRRLFLKSCLAAGAVAAVPGWAFAAQREPRLHTRSALLLGTTVSMTVAHKDAALADAALQAAFTEVERLQSVFNRHDSASALGVLNSQGTLADAPQELCLLLDESLALGRRTDGAFNISVAPLVDLLEQSAQNYKRPSASALAEARALVDLNAVKVSGRSIRLEKSGMRITLDGIAKGDIADYASRALLKAGISDFMVNAGGDIYAAGRKPDGNNWMVAVESPEPGGAYPAVVPLHNTALATSGTYEKNYGAQGRLNHLIQPQTGLSQQYFKSVTVSAPSVKLADALATALSAMRPADAMRAVNAMPGCAALFIDNGGKVYGSDKWV